MQDKHCIEIDVIKSVRTITLTCIIVIDLQMFVHDSK